MSRAVSVAAALSSALFFTFPAAADVSNLLTNGSFETGDFSGWTPSGNLQFTTVEASGSGPFMAEDGGYYVLEGPVGSLGYLSQSFDDQASQTYTISGWIYGSGWEPSQVVFYWGSGAADLTPVLTINPVVSTGSWVQYYKTVTASGHDTFQVGFRNDPAFDGLDNFAVTLGSTPSVSGDPTPGLAAPEAPVWVMMVAGFIGLALAGARHRRSSASIA